MKTKKIVTHDLPSKGKATTGFTRPIRVDPTSHSIRASRAKPSMKKGEKRLVGVLTPSGMIPASEGVARKFLRMTLAERTKFVELFGGFSSLDWRRFRHWIRKLNGEKK